MRNTVAAIVILYKPSSSVVNCIQSYEVDVEKIFIVDNSPEDSARFLKELKKSSKVTYMPMKSNIGIACALNIGAEKAWAEGFLFALTMDQDSIAKIGMVEELQKCQLKHPDAGIISPVHRVKNDIIEELHGDEEELLTVMTSGNLLNLDIFKKMNGFMEKLFIDYVDHEYCLRLHLNGYKIIRANSAILYHQVGDLQERKFIFWNVHPSNHSPQRWYYQTRNRFYLRRLYKKEYPEYFHLDFRLYFMSVIKMLLFEDERFKKISIIMRAFKNLNANNFSSNPI